MKQRETLVPSLTMLYQSSINTAIVPRDWTNINVTLALRKGERHKAENYQPVFLTSVLRNVLEHIIAITIMNCAEHDNILVK